MKKRTSISLIVAAALILSGVILIAAGCFSTGFDPQKLNSSQWQERTYVVKEPFESIQVNTTTCDVIFVKSEDSFRAVCPETDKLSYTVIVEDGLLKIDAVELRDWRDFIGFFDWADLDMQVYLPEEVYTTLYVRTSTGDVTIPDSFTFSTAEVLSDTGDIDCAAKIIENLSVCTSTGDIQAQGSAPADLSLRSDTGDVTLHTADGAGNIQIRTTTGDIQVTDVSCQSLTCESDTGDTELNSMLSAEALKVQTTTGDVTVRSCDAESVDIQTDTGDISGSFLTSKWFQASSDTGDVTVPQTREGGVCHMESNTGDISFH